MHGSMAKAKSWARRRMEGWEKSVNGGAGLDFVAIEVGRKWGWTAEWGEGYRGCGAE
jgi:hypothetical protein